MQEIILTLIAVSNVVIATVSLLTKRQTEIILQDVNSDRSKRVEEVQSLNSEITLLREEIARRNQKEESEQNQEEIENKVQKRESEKP